MKNKESIWIMDRRRTGILFEIIVKGNPTVTYDQAIQIYFKNFLKGNTYNPNKLIKNEIDGSVNYGDTITMRYCPTKWKPKIIDSVIQL